MFKPLPYCSRLGSRLQDHDVRYTCLAAYNLFAEDPRLLLRMFSSRRCVIEKALFFSPVSPTAGTKCRNCTFLHTRDTFDLLVSHVLYQQLYK